jgi:hypothetical protein
VPRLSRAEHRPPCRLQDEIEPTKCAESQPADLTPWLSKRIQMLSACFRQTLSIDQELTSGQTGRINGRSHRLKRRRKTAARRPKQAVTLALISGPCLLAGSPQLVLRSAGAAVRSIFMKPRASVQFRQAPSAAPKKSNALCAHGGIILFRAPTQRSRCAIGWIKGDAEVHKSSEQYAVTRR